MASHSFQAFRWSGTYYNAVYNASYSATVTDDDGAYEGRGDGDERISIDGGPPGTSAGQPYAIDVSFTDTGGAAHVETFHFFNTGGDWYFAPGPGSDFTVGARLGMYQGHTVGWDYAQVACFLSGTAIETAQGPRPVETLRLGDQVITTDGQQLSVRLCPARAIGPGELAAYPRLRPVRITAGALGRGLPHRDLLVSRQHRMLVSSPVARRLFGHQSVLVPALRLTVMPGIFPDTDLRELTYHHILLDRHAVILAEGAPSESLFTGPCALAALGPAGQDAVRAVIGKGNHPPKPAFPVPAPKGQKQLIGALLRDALPVLA